MTFAERISRTLHDLGKSQAWLSEQSGVDEGTISAIIKRNSQRTKYAPELARALGVRLEWLLRGDGEKLHQGTVPHVVRQTPASYAGLNPMAADVAKAWMRLSTAKQQFYREAIFRDAASETVLPWLTMARPHSMGYEEFEARIQQDYTQQLQQLKLDL